MTSPFHPSRSAQEAHRGATQPQPEGDASRLEAADVPQEPATLQVIGYLEEVALPRWGLALTAKVDTGADTSALHVEQVQTVGTTRVAFTVSADADVARRLPVLARIVRRGLVRCSSGDEEERIFVRTAITLGGRTRVVELGLVDRSRMQHRMLLGRSALGGVFLVDPSRAFLSPRGGRVTVEGTSHAGRSRSHETGGPP